MTTSFKRKSLLAYLKLFILNERKREEKEKNWV